MVKTPRKTPQARKTDHAAETIASFAPPPHWIEPCIPTLVAKPPKGDRWRHEVKWDRYRVSVVIDAGKAKVRSRRGHSWSDKFKSSAASEAPMIARKPRRSHIYLLMYRRYQETIARPAPFEYHCAMPRSPSVGPGPHG
jgi:hypothetical protein